MSVTVAPASRSAASSPRPGPASVRRTAAVVAASRRGAQRRVVLLFLFCVFPVYWMVNTSFLPNNETRGSDVPLLARRSSRSRNYQRCCSTRAHAVPPRRAELDRRSRPHGDHRAASSPSSRPSRSPGSGSWAGASFIIAILLIQMLPAEAMIVSLYQDDRRLAPAQHDHRRERHLHRDGLPFTIWMLRGFVNGVPAELEEAAMVDGSAAPGAFLRITFPLLAPGLVATGVFAFLQAWNEFMVALVLSAEPSSSRPCRSGCAASCRRARPRDRLGPGHGGLDPRGDPRHRVLPHRPGADDQRSRERGGQGMSAARLTADRAGPSLPGSSGRSFRTGLPRACATGLAGVCLFGENIVEPQQLRALTDASAPPTRARSSRSTRRAATSPASTTTRVAVSRQRPARPHRRPRTHRARSPRASARELRDVGVQPQLRPDVDINSNPDNPVIGVRSFGADPEPSPPHARPGSRATRPTASRRARSTSPATATRRPTRTSRCRSSTCRSRRCASASSRRSRPRSPRARARS